MGRYECQNLIFLSVYPISNSGRWTSPARDMTVSTESAEARPRRVFRNPSPKAASLPILVNGRAKTGMAGALIAARIPANGRFPSPLRSLASRDAEG